MLRYLYLFTAFMGAIVFMGCGTKKSSLFEKLESDVTEIKFKNTLFEDGPLNVANYLYFYNGGGVAIGDINNDGLQDVLFTGNMVKNRLYLNKGNFKFEDITVQSGIADKQGWCTGATMADINGDGKLDIYICRSADINPEMRKNLLFINNGNLSFTEKAAEYGLGNTGYSTQATFLDYDKDGDLDCFIINHSLQKYSAGVQDNPEIRKESNPDYSSKLLQNNNGKFTDVSLQAGITSNVLSYGLGLAVSDINNDGWPDIMVSNDFNEQDYLFVNNGNGTFTEQLSKSMDQVSLYSMGSDAADYNNDGLIDYVTLDMMPEDNRTIKMHAGPENFDKFQQLFSKGFYYQYSRNMLQKNNGDGTFSEVAQLAGVSNTDWSWAALFSDFDNDGNKDLFITNGYVKDYTEMDFLKYSVDRVVRTMHKDSVDPIPEYIKKMPTNRIANYMFQNAANGTFTNRTADWGFDEKGVSAGAAYVDLDNDGDMDLVVNNSNDFASIYKNNAPKTDKDNFLKIKLQGDSRNERGIGAKVTVYCKNNKYYQEEEPVRGFQSSVDPVLNFGVGSNAIVDSVVVIWPGDEYQRIASVKPGQTLTVKLSDAKEKWVYQSANNQQFISTTLLPGVNHTENDFNDFTVQSLLPNYLSRQGPCIEVADINKDGSDDFFIGGAKGKPSAVFVQNAAGGFVKIPQPSLEKDSASEDVAAAFFDADNDGDVDLYVASGGYEFNETDTALQDRLYLNDGKGNFIKQENSLPKMIASSGCVKAADIDADGDLDLFVGGRVIPGRYPVSPESYILLNNGKGIFTNETATVCAALKQPGMVTDVAWLDVNNDKLPDLVVVGEWMPVKVFLNSKGRLTDASASYIHFTSGGWWNKINGTDMDGDGDLDLVIGNCGSNTQFKVTDKEPITVTYTDFDGNGSIDPVICYYINGVSYPAASRDDLTDQLPLLKKKFLEYSSYSNATITDIFSAEELQHATTLKAETMKTVYLENQGTKGFVLHELPLEAQNAPVYAITSADINGDGHNDLLLGGNNTWTRIKFGRYTANHGVLLAGDGKGDFAYVPQFKSGLQIKGNMRSLQVVKGKSGERIIAGINNSPAVLLGISKK